LTRSTNPSAFSYIFSNLNEYGPLVIPLLSSNMKNDLIRDEILGIESSLENALPNVEKLGIYSNGGLGYWTK
jgi:hypothetical protein